MLHDKANDAVTLPSTMRELTLDELDAVGGGDSEPPEPFEWPVPWPGRPMPKPI